ncbi:hypothetical protein Q5752_005284 [Cryptotrichosporon argae]
MRLLPLLAAAAIPLALAHSSPAPAVPTPAPGTTAPSLARRVFAAFTGGPTTDLAARAADDAAAGVERVTDDNYAALVRPAEDEVWVLFIHGPPADPMSALYLPAHANASQLVHARLADAARDPAAASETTARGLGKTYRFGRVDFDADICTRWLVMSAPYVVFITHNATRFLHPRAVEPVGETWADLVLSQGWATLTPWASRYGPGGDRAWLVEAYLALARPWAKYAGRVPNIVWMMLSGWVGQRLVAWMHGSGAPARPAEGAGAARAPTARTAPPARNPAEPATAARAQNAQEKTTVVGASAVDAGAEGGARKRK